MMRSARMSSKKNYYYLSFVQWMGVVAATLCTLLFTSIGLLPVVQVVDATEIGKEVCIEGYVMDLFCINRGTLLDNPRVETLLNPEMHSYHCLLDVRPCFNSGYEVLLDPTANETYYTRALRFDDNGNDLVLEVGRAHGREGFCTTCTGEEARNDVGFRAVVIGTIMDMGTSIQPPLLSVTSLEEAQVSLGCPDNIIDLNSDEAREQFVTPIMMEAGSGVLDPFTKSAYIHGSLMLIGWGWLLPTGALVAKFFKHHDPLWFHIHRLCQMIGLVCATAGFAIAVRNFDAFNQKGYTAYTHAVMGTLVMAIGFFQPINALLRPHKTADGEVSTLRFVWELVHKGLGWIALLLAIATIGLGTTLLPRNNRTFQMAYGIGCGIFFIILIPCLMMMKPKNNKDDDDGGENEKPSSVVPPQV